jgi:hypothetical protein
MTILIDQVIASHTEEYHGMKALHEIPQYVHLTNPDFVTQNLIPGLLQSIVYIWGIFIGCIIIGRFLYPKASKLENQIGAHKMTHFLGNVSISLMGLYFYMKLPASPNNLSVKELTTGFTEVYPLPCLQVAKQSWALLIGLIMGKKERIINYTHHLAVTVVSVCLMCLTIGFRYHVPFILGVMETTSIFLAGIEAMRDYPEQGSRRYPGLYIALQVLFALSFLYVRCYLFLPQAWLFLRLGFFALHSIDHPMWLPTLWFAWFSWTAGCFLVLLQAYWGVLIVKKLVRDIFFRKLRPHPTKEV